MIHDGAHLSGGSFHHNVLVNLMIPAVGIVFRDLFVSAEPMFKQAQVPIGEVSTTVGSLSQ